MLPFLRGMLPDYRFAFQQDGSCSTSASSKRFCCPGISSDLLTAEGPKSFLSDNLPVPEELSRDWFFSSIIRRRALISSVCSDIIVFSCDTVSFSSRSWISFALEAVVSLLGFDSFIIPERGAFTKGNGS